MSYVLLDSRGYDLPGVYGPFETEQLAANAAEAMLEVTVDANGDLPDGVHVRPLTAAEAEAEAEPRNGRPAPAPPFETSTSPLYRSNDGRLEIYAERQTVPAGWIVADKTDDHVERFTLKRETADAFVAGYDYAMAAPWRATMREED